MSSPTPDQIFKQILAATHERLKPLGYVKSAQTFRHIADGNCALIDFQRSVKNSRDTLLFTVNLGVVCGKLIDPHFADIRKARIVDAHLRQRIGKFLAGHPDKWWEITATTNPLSLVEELLDLLLNQGVPFIESHLATTALVSLWKSGPSPGLTVGQRNSFLAKLGEQPAAGP